MHRGDATSLGVELYWQIEPKQSVQPEQSHERALLGRSLVNPSNCIYDHPDL